jgi:hypothetical protein
MASRTRLLRSGGLLVLAVLLGIQFIPVERTNPEVRLDVSAPAQVDSILRPACYDCHSNETRWPWYSHVAPVSWFVAGHVHEGRGDLNFSEWPAFDFELQANLFHDIEEQVLKGKMPLRSYQLLHPEARLSQRDREVLLRWARSNQ